MLCLNARVHIHCNHWCFPHQLEFADAQLAPLHPQDLELGKPGAHHSCRSGYIWIIPTCTSMCRCAPAICENVRIEEISHTHVRPVVKRRGQHLVSELHGRCPSRPYLTQVPAVWLWDQGISRQLDVASR